MAISIGSAAGTLILAFLIYKTLSFARFYIHARRAGFPILITPVFSKSVPWLILGPTFQQQFEKYLPEWIYERLDLVIHGWEFRNGRKYHERFGSTFSVVTPDEVSIWCADPDLSQEILQRRIDFPQAPIVAKVLGFFGPNVFCTNGDAWKRHRRMFAANLDERISRTVWSESVEQASEMLRYMLSDPENSKETSTLSALQSVAINVIGQAGYSQKVPWKPNLRERDGETKTGKAAYFETLVLASEKVMEAAMLPPRFLQMSFMPEALRLLGYHMERVGGYIAELFEEERCAEREKDASATSRRNNFLSLLLKLSDEGKRTGDGEFSLTDDEISGSLYVFSTAGYETTSNTMGYAVTYLAAYPEWQDWMREELQGLNEDSLTWNYDEVYVKCKRTLAVMLEILRLYPPVLHSTRAVLTPQTLTSPNGKTHVLTPPMDLYACQLSVHLDPSIWGPDVTEFNPSRWINDFGELITPAKGTYLPWSSGPRICPGLKMSQVEFVATMATLFRKAGVEASPVGGVTDRVELRRRLLGIARDSFNALTLQMRNKEGVKVRWVEV
ncbi:cytochrome P450 [Aspergillus venezuelensis]